MNAATIQVLDEMILGTVAKKVLFAVSEPAAFMALCVVYKKLGADRMIDEYEEGLSAALASEGNLMRYALSACDVPLGKQEEIVKRTVRRITVLFVGYIDKMSKGEPIDDEHAEFIRDKAKVEAASSVGDKLRAYADMLDKRGQSVTKGKFSA